MKKRREANRVQRHAKSETQTQPRVNHQRVTQTSLWEGKQEYPTLAPQKEGMHGRMLPSPGGMARMSTV